VNQPCVEVCSLLVPDRLTACDRSVDGGDVCASDDGVVCESLFTRCDDFDVVGSDGIDVNLAATAVGDLRLVRR